MEIIYNNEIAKETIFYGYFVTKSGKVLSAKIKGGQGKIDLNNLREHCYKIDKDGYIEYCFSDDNKHYYRRGHRIVWETFNGPICDELTIDHINGIRTDNRLSNLRLLTREDNTSLALKDKKSSKRFLYQVGTEILDRNEIEERFSFSNKFWYRQENKIQNSDDYIYQGNIFKRV